MKHAMFSLMHIQMYLKYLIWLAHVFQGWNKLWHQWELFITQCAAKSVKKIHGIRHTQFFDIEYSYHMFTKHCWNNNKNTSLTNKIASNNQKNWWFWKIVQLFYLLCHKCLILLVSKFVSLTAQFEGINHSLSETIKEFHIPLISLKRLEKKAWLYIYIVYQ